MRFRDRASDAMMKALNVVHRGVLRVTGGRLGGTLIGLPAIELVTIGRSSGKRRSVMLMAPVHGDGRYVVVASKGGDDRDPDWYRNLVANPEVEVVVRGYPLRMRARTATAAEKAELWPAITSTYRGYARYQRKTSRDIPVVICEAVA